MRALVLISVLLAVAPACLAGTVAFAPAEDQVPQWMQSAGAVTLIGNGFLGNRFVRLEDGDSVATWLTPSALSDSLYGMTAALAMFASGASWTLEVFAGGLPEAGSGAPAGSTLLISASGTLPTLSDEDAPVWFARGTGYSTLLQAPVAGTPVWLRVRAVGGALGIDSILGVENNDWSVWFPGSNPTQLRNTNWDFELDSELNAPLAGIPEPATLSLIAPALFALLLFRRR